MNRDRQLPFVAWAVLAMSFVGCDRGPELRPAAGAYEVRDREAAAARVQDGVRVMAQAGEWPGDIKIISEVTPLRVILENGSQRPVQVRYSSFTLTAADGATYHAIPPRYVAGDGNLAVTPIRPGFNAVGFRAAPYYGAAFDGLGSFVGEFPYDSDYYETYDSYWEQTLLLPTREMVAVAMPEGVLEPNGRLDGFLYFERLRQPDGSEVTFRAALHSAEGDEPLGSVRLPFVID